MATGRGGATERVTNSVLTGNVRDLLARQRGRTTVQKSFSGGFDIGSLTGVAQGGAFRGRVGGGVGVTRKRSPFAEEVSAGRGGRAPTRGIRSGAGNPALKRFKRPLGY